MFKNIILLPIVFLALSCSSFNVNTELNYASSLEAPKKIGVIVRTSTKTKANRSEITKNLSYWLNGYKHLVKLDLIADLSESIAEYSIDDERLFQISDESSFLRYKSIGILKSFIRSNKEKLNEIMTQNSYDALIIYEIDGIYSAEMLCMSYDSVITILDKKFEPVFLDYQKDNKECSQYEPSAIKREMMDQMSQRFLEKMIDLDYIEEF